MSNTMRDIVIAGAGTGSLTPEVADALSSADVVFADGRLAPLIPPGKRVLDIMSWRKIEDESGCIVVLVSGDPGVFSLLPVIKSHFPRDNITVLPGISSLQALCARAGETWHNAAILSGHGRPLNPGIFLNTCESNRITILFCDNKISPSWACEKLTDIPGVDVVIGSCLGGNDERVYMGSPQDFAGREFPGLSIILVRNNSPYSPASFIRDKEFLREPGIVMTNEAVRAVIMSRLELEADSVFWDIGAGSGSISVTAGSLFPSADIHAVDFNPTATSLTSRNASRFHVHNITVHNSRALEVIAGLPEPSCVFIGGTGGELSGILGHVSAMKRRVRVVIACVTLETLAEAFVILREWEDFEAVQISASASKQLAPSLTMMKAANPVTILSANHTV
ncbi:MAG: precorrin-6y C5,15-methyltransferase (decarboxylating) subunit CbiE [Synergistaceae bacterium]|nr:precorrin-6y C5,15-methyltransferase (decarboxylating) subunit CbiE [Synergistaceae bacterium]